MEPVKTPRRYMTLGLLLLLPLVLSLVVRTFPGKRPPYLGVREQRLAACPTSPNCVCSQSRDSTHHVDPIGISERSPLAVFAVAARAVEQMPRTRIVPDSRTEEYLHAECRSRLFGFVDDLELWLDRQSNQIQIRSASRLGHSDLGVNRQRVERLRSAIESMLSTE